MTLYIATNNAHKVKELAELFPGIPLRTPADAGIEFDHDETEDSFLGNSLGKARALFGLVKAPVLADDSGLCVDALGGAPGVRSARYGSPDDGRTVLSARDKNELLLREMEGRRDRTCRFVCAMTLMLSEHRFVTVQETCEGRLLESSRGAEGFGYDPVFFLPGEGLSMAELSLERKNRLSHRGRAAARILAVLASLPD
ncbi:MAG TPA: RdgB/HAM1 family non-canonical purine NTP pyrophosphatase [Spirochaetia bacterium]|nr:RdgB/HAM1 family non-canonical purine NTP pyrophosphatase [Spirochaetia bacterium]HRZ89036.1 RdgB/HAM1 family non-canonical purine NTP pyrophosphatase [Spirochaetia bacterium]